MTTLTPSIVSSAGYSQPNGWSTSWYFPVVGGKGHFGIFFSWLWAQNGSTFGVGLSDIPLTSVVNYGYNGYYCTAIHVADLSNLSGTYIYSIFSSYSRPRMGFAIEVDNTSSVGQSSGVYLTNGGSDSLSSLSIGSLVLAGALRTATSYVANFSGGWTTEVTDTETSSSTAGAGKIGYLIADNTTETLTVDYGAASGMIELIGLEKNRAPVWII